MIHLHKPFNQQTILEKRAQRLYNLKKRNPKKYTEQVKQNLNKPLKNK